MQHNFVISPSNECSRAGNRNVVPPCYQSQPNPTRPPMHPTVVIPATTASATKMRERGRTTTKPPDQHAVAVRVYGGNRKPLPHPSHHIETIQRAARPGSTNGNYDCRAYESCPGRHCRCLSLHNLNKQDLELKLFPRRPLFILHSHAVTLWRVWVAE